MPTKNQPRVNPRIRNRIAELCRDRNLTMNSIATRLGRAKATIPQIASGRSLPSGDVLVELCDILECNVGDLFYVEK
jgi:transcriptional regulator with XRE-family HTH domain